jgi:hypothetical protein
VVCALAGALSNRASAEEPASVETASPSINPYQWESAPAEEQLAADKTPVPGGKGALFVPRLTRRSSEPAISIVNKGEVTAGKVGQRIVLPPGDYVVIVGSTTPKQSVSVPVTVTEGETSLVPVHWGGLRIEVVDDKLIPHRGSYELIRADNREVYGVGFGADTLQGETLNVWLLPPGLYRVLQTGQSYRARTDFATVYVPENGLARFRLVMDPNSEEFRGAGVLVPGEFGATAAVDERWKKYLVLGMNGSLTQSSDVVGATNQMVLTGDVFAEGYVAYDHNRHFVSALGEVEAGLSQTRPAEGAPLPLLKTKDRLRTDLLYTWFAKEDVFGPYVRAGVLTQALPTEILTSEDVTIAIRELDGTQSTRVLLANETFQVADPWRPTILREGVGVNTRIVDNRYVTLAWRVGFGMRQNMFEGTLVEDDLAGTEAIEYNRLSSFNQEGIESTVRGIFRLTGWAVYSTDVEFFTDFNTLDQPTIEWGNTLSMRVTEYLALNYNADLVRLPQVSDKNQFSQSVLLRASWSVF